MPAVISVTPVTMCEFPQGLLDWYHILIAIESDYASVVFVGFGTISAIWSPQFQNDQIP